MCIIIVLAFITSVFSGCGSESYTFPYDAEYGVSSFQIVHTVNASLASPFACDLCIATEDVTDIKDLDLTEVGAALLCDLNNSEILYSKGAHEKLHPASLTKVMTALVALKYGSMDQILTASDVVNIEDGAATVCGIKPGDSMTLSQAMHLLLVYSANDAALMIAEGVAGSVEEFVALMNKEAKEIGATNSSFANPHGLTEDNHYTTAYDMYLMFNEAIKYELFREMIHMAEYSTVYHDKNGKEKEVSVRTSDRFLRGDYSLPENVTLVGGKTGTTNAAGHCLILLTRDTAGAPYISVILRAKTKEDVYKKIAELLKEIGK